MQTKQSRGLNEAQLRLLQMFNRPMSKKEIDELKDVLVEFFDAKAQCEMDKIWKEKMLSQEIIDDMGNMHKRIPYN